jgi:CHAD domain-containing protein
LRKDGTRDGIHGARKEIKKVRSLLRLARPELEPAEYHKSVKCLREAAQDLAGCRDARVLLKAFEKVAGGDESFSYVRKALQINARREFRLFKRDQSKSRAQRKLRSTRRRLRDLKMTATEETVMPAVRRSYRQNRRASQLAAKRSEPALFHEWRKRVKDLSYFLSLLPARTSRPIKALTRELDRLAEQLGDDHDLFLLHEFIRDECRGHSREIKEADRIIARQRRKIRASARNLGARFFARSGLASGDDRRHDE